MPVWAGRDSKNFLSISQLTAEEWGGGWGREKPFEGSSRVAIIRGADFPSVAQGSYGGLPVRYEKNSKVNSVALRAGDIVLENSGGTDSRPTGRTVFVTNELIDAYDCPVIPASFCRLLRFDNRANNEFVYYWLQEMYSAGRTWGYQNRSTGLSNFQYKVFADSERLRGRAVHGVAEVRVPAAGDDIAVRRCDLAHEVERERDGM